MGWTKPASPRCDNEWACARGSMRPLLLGAAIVQTPDEPPAASKNTDDATATGNSAPLDESTACFSLWQTLSCVVTRFTLPDGNRFRWRRETRVWRRMGRSQWRRAGLPPHGPVVVGAQASDRRYTGASEWPAEKLVQSKARCPRRLTSSQASKNDADGVQVGTRYQVVSLRAIIQSI